MGDEIEHGVSHRARRRKLISERRLAFSLRAGSDCFMEAFGREHTELTRRFFLRLGAAGAAALSCLPWNASAGDAAPELVKALSELEPYFTPQAKFRDVSRGKP